MLLGHRGDPANHAENSLQGFASAVACGADGVELDVQVSADGTPVVIHDATVDRTTSLVGRVDAFSAGELKEVGVPRLAEAVAALRGHRIAIELKPSFDERPDLSRTVLDLTTAADDVMLLAFDHRHLVAVRGQVRCAALVRERPQRPRAVLDACGAEMLAAQWRQIDEALCADVPVIAWTVDAEQDARRLIAIGVVALISNRPCALRAVVPSPRR